MLRRSLRQVHRGRWQVTAIVAFREADFVPATIDANVVCYRGNGSRYTEQQLEKGQEKIVHCYKL